VIHVDTDATLYSDVDHSVHHRSPLGHLLQADFHFGGVQGGAMPFKVKADPAKVTSTPTGRKQSSEDEPPARVDEPQSSAHLELEPGDQFNPASILVPKPSSENAPVSSQTQDDCHIGGRADNVGRRLYRTGDSDYLMNGRACLLGTFKTCSPAPGLEARHYAIIEQGRIGQILSSKPLDRRALIEEAAGITKFKSRKRATELKLESAKQNLTRLNDIISEVETPGEQPQASGTKGPSLSPAARRNAVVLKIIIYR